MQILSIRCGLTRNLGNFESAKLEVEAAPSDGQTHAALLEEVKEYLEKALPEGGAGSDKKPAGRKPKTRKPRANKSTTKEPTAEKPNAALTDTASADTEDKFNPADRATSAKPTKDEARDVFKILQESDTLEQLLERFNKFRDPGLGYRDLLTKEEWAKSINVVQDCYKSLTTADSNADVMHDLVAAISGERNVAR